jgi:hypothetical protein
MLEGREAITAPRLRMQQQTLMLATPMVAFAATFSHS